MLWDLSDHESLRLRWRECARSDVDAMETRLIGQFKAAYKDARPFANRAK